MNRESILAEVREAMTQPGFTSDGSFVPPLKLKFTHLASLYAFFFCMLAECVDISNRSNTVGSLKKGKRIAKDYNH